MRRLWAPVTVAALALAACGGPATADKEGAGTGEPTAFPLVASSDLAVGRERLLVALYGEENRSIASPELGVRMELRAPDGEIFLVDGEFLWTIPDVRGIYKAEVSLDQAGEWALILHPEGAPLTDPVPFVVSPEPSTLGIGDPAPSSDTLTAEDGALEDISTDPDPDPRFYRLSVAEAVASGRPTVLVFATPAFCQTQICGPTLEVVKQAADAHPDVNFVHVEPFDLDELPESLVPVPAVEEWGLRTEPWVFVIGSDGRLTARFEGTLTAEELGEALTGA